MNFDIQFDIKNNTINMISNKTDYAFKPEIGYWDIRQYALSWGFSTYDILDGDDVSFLMLDMKKPDIICDKKALRCIRTHNDRIQIDQVIIKSAEFTHEENKEFLKIVNYDEIQKDPYSLLPEFIVVTRHDFEQWHFGEFQDLMG